MVFPSLQDPRESGFVRPGCPDRNLHCLGASWFANNFVVSEYDGALDTNAVFLFAIGIVVIANSILSEITLVDGLILVQFSWGFISTVMTIWGYRTAVYQQEGARGAFRFGGWALACVWPFCPDLRHSTSGFGPLPSMVPCAIRDSHVMAHGSFSSGPSHSFREQGSSILSLLEVCVFTT